MMQTQTEELLLIVARAVRHILSDRYNSADDETELEKIDDALAPFESASLHQPDLDAVTELYEALEGMLRLVCSSPTVVTHHPVVVAARAALAKAVPPHAPAPESK